MKKWHRNGQSTNQHECPNCGKRTHFNYWYSETKQQPCVKYKYVCIKCGAEFIGIESILNPKKA